MDSEQQTNEEFRENIISYVEAESIDSGERPKLVFLHEMLTYLDGLTSEWGEDPDYYVDERVQASHHTDDWESLDFLISDYHGRNTIQLTEYSTEKSLKKRFVECRKILRAGLEGLYENFEEANELRGLVKSIYEHKGEIRSIRYILITDYQVKTPPPQDEYDGEFQVKYEVWGLDDIYKLYCSEQTSTSDLEIDLVEDFGERIPCLKVDFGDSDVEYASYLGFMKAGLLADLYDKYNEKLLEGNIRVFLQTTTSVNKGILSTLSHDTEKTRFFAYNNGISATASSVSLTEPDTNGFRWIESVRGLQIVNGGQTTASIHTAKKKNRKNVDGVYVQMKLTVPLKSGGMKGLNEKIAKYSNTQNQIKKADFTANVPYQIRLSDISRTVLIPGHEYGWFYERIRGQYSEQERLQTSSNKGKKNAIPFESRFPKSRKLTKTDIALHYNAWNQYPQFAAKGGEKNYQKFLSLLENADGEIDLYPDERYFRELISMSILFIRTDILVNDWQKGGGSTYGNGYKREILLYTLSLLSYMTEGRFNLEKIWDCQVNHGVTKKTFRLPEVLENYLKELIILAEYHIRHPPSYRSDAREWAKTDECWQTFRDQKAGNKHPPVPEELIDMFYLSEEEVKARQAWISSLKKTGSIDIVPVDFVQEESGDDEAEPLEIPDEAVVEKEDPVPDVSGSVEHPQNVPEMPDFWRFISTARHGEWCKLSDWLVSNYELSEGEIKALDSIKKRKASYLGVLEADLSVIANTLIRSFNKAVPKKDTEFFIRIGRNPGDYIGEVTDNVPESQVEESVEISEENQVSEPIRQTQSDDEIISGSALTLPAHPEIVEQLEPELFDFSTIKMRRDLTKALRDNMKTLGWENEKVKILSSLLVLGSAPKSRVISPMDVKNKAYHDSFRKLMGEGVICVDNSHVHMGRVNPYYYLHDADEIWDSLQLSGDDKIKEIRHAYDNVVSELNNPLTSGKLENLTQDYFVKSSEISSICDRIVRLGLTRDVAYMICYLHYFPGVTESEIYSTVSRLTMTTKSKLSARFREICNMGWVAFDEMRQVPQNSLAKPLAETLDDYVTSSSVTIQHSQDTIRYIRQYLSDKAYVMNPAGGITVKGTSGTMSEFDLNDTDSIFQAIEECFTNLGFLNVDSELLSLVVLRKIVSKDELYSVMKYDSDEINQALDELTDYGLLEEIYDDESEVTYYLISNLPLSYLFRLLLIAGYSSERDPDMISNLLSLYDEYSEMCKSGVKDEESSPLFQKIYDGMSDLNFPQVEGAFILFWLTHPDMSFDALARNLKLTGQKYEDTKSYFIRMGWAAESTDMESESAGNLSISITFPELLETYLQYRKDASSQGLQNLIRICGALYDETTDEQEDEA